ncbi:hypothetical protein IH601_09465 [Candidatus Bipolaricaulota bacterium]|nr:hypothetical protein [Candidatus Bipolaricaulota bacterium]
MRRMSAQVALGLIVLLFTVGMGPVAASEVGFFGSVGLDVSYTPVPPASYNIGSDLTLAFSISGFSFASETGFDLYGFQSQAVTLGVDLGAVQISEEIRFEPLFSWNELSVDISIVGVHIGFDLILADIVGPQTPTYSMGSVLELSSGIVCGFTLTSLTGFGAIDLVNLLGGIEAPFSYNLLYLFNHLSGLCIEQTDLDVTIVPGFYFEEELIRLEVETFGLIASNTTWFDNTGLVKSLFEMGYQLTEPSMAFMTSMSLDSGFTITGLDFIVDLQIDVVRFTSHTSFTELLPVAIIPIVFDAQRFAVSFQLCDVLITTTTTFDSSFFFAEQVIAIEATIDPVTFRSLTTFDATGFVGQCIYADVQFCGVLLFTKAEFDFSGIQLVTVGFDLGFGMY